MVRVSGCDLFSRPDRLECPGGDRVGFRLEVQRELPRRVDGTLVDRNTISVDSTPAHKVTPLQSA